MSHTNLRDLVRPDPRERRVQLDDGIPPCEGQCGYSRFGVPERFHLVEYRKGRSWWSTHCCEQCLLGQGHGRLCFFACRRCGVETPPDEIVMPVARATWTVVSGGSCGAFPSAAGL